MEFFRRDHPQSAENGAVEQSSGKFKIFLSCQLPELLREFSDYRMLVYAIVLILVMLATNNPTIKSFFSRIFRRKGGAEA